MFEEIEVADSENRTPGSKFRPKKSGFYGEIINGMMVHTASYTWFDSGAPKFNFGGPELKFSPKSAREARKLISP